MQEPPDSRFKSSQQPRKPQQSPWPGEGFSPAVPTASPHHSQGWWKCCSAGSPGPPSLSTEGSVRAGSETTLKKKDLASAPGVAFARGELSPGGSPTFRRNPSAPFRHHSWMSFLRVLLCAWKQSHVEFGAPGSVPLIPKGSTGQVALPRGTDLPGTLPTNSLNRNPSQISTWKPLHCSQ